MAQVVLGGVGSAIGGSLGGVIGSTLGGMIDRSLIAGLQPPRQKGVRLTTLALQGAAEGAPISCVFGRARVTGQVIWAARFLESRKTSSGGKGGPRTVEYGYSLSFAVALCEGPIDGIGRVWADGQPMDLTGVTMRFYRGTETQTPDALIDAVEALAPAYRGTAYVVFEDLPLGAYGNRPPQLMFEVFRRPEGDEPRLEDRLEGVCLIPGAGEFALASEPIMRREGLTRTVAENLHGSGDRVDLTLSLDQLLAQAPNLKRVSLVIGWFGDDLRAGHCTIRPGVERTDKPTEPRIWSVAGLERHEARLISRSGDGPAYGGTPSDQSVRQAVAALKARGLEVTLYPFVFMDVPPANALPDPYGGVEQAAYPWRGRVMAAAGAGATAEVAAVFGGAGGWGLRRLALHYAAMAAETGADGLLIGSEMRELTRTRDAAGGYPAVSALRALAAECRALVGPELKLSYAADWSEYFGHHEDAEVVFHLDPLWADPNIDYVGIDWYPPLGDWRAGTGGLDGVNWSGADDRAGLAAQVAGGEGFDWFYASPTDRAAQVRRLITDQSHGEDWLFRPKDLMGWWSNFHHDRPEGIRAATPTAWVPGMKPVRLTEFGCAAVDRGGNAPNLFQDPKSAESGLPPFSTGYRDDRMQRRTIEAILAHFADPTNNPISSVYGGRMLAAADVWCWDARPWPAFPARSDVWADAGAWRTGHWLNGRLGGETRDLIAAILKRSGLGEADFEIGDTGAEVQGYVIDRPMRIRDALEPLLAGLGMIATERAGRVAIVGAEPAALTLIPESLALSEDGEGLRSERVLEQPPGVARVRFIDGNADYQTGSAVVRGSGEGGGVDLDFPAVCSQALARTAAARALEVGGQDRLTASLGPLASLRLEPGDLVEVDGDSRTWRTMRLEMSELPSVVLEPVSAAVRDDDDGAPLSREPVSAGGAPFFRMIELPPLPGAEADGRPIAVVAAEPWWPMRVFAGPDADSLRDRGRINQPTTVGVLVSPLVRGVRYRWDDISRLTVRIEGRRPESLSPAAVLAGGNAVAVETEAGWEVVQYRNAELVGDDLWLLSGLLRGQQGTDGPAATGAESGALVVFLGAGMERADSPSAERGLPLLWRATRDGAPPGGPNATEVTFAPAGLLNRPWSPAHLRCARREDGGVDLAWIPRSRIDGDRWEGVTEASDLMRFRIRVLNGGLEVRVIEAVTTAAIYAAIDVVADLPGGFANASVAVAQWGSGYGWGVETQASLA